MWAIKVFIEVCGLPVSLSLAVLKQRQKVWTCMMSAPKFSIFSLDAKYAFLNNRYSNARIKHQTSTVAPRCLHSFC